MSRPEWRRVSRCYEIRRDLEHEDDEYEAGPEDCFYIFSTCISVILSKDPIQLIRVTDIKALVEQASPALPDATVIEDFSGAPVPRQKQILEMLINFAMDPNLSDLVQQNSHTFLRYLSAIAPPPTLTAVGTTFQENVGRFLDERTVRVALAANIYPYLRASAKEAFFELEKQKFSGISTDWSAYDHHGALLRNFQENGGLYAAPENVRDFFVLWMLRTYLGKAGGLTRYGNIRNVYYSNTASPVIKSIFLSSGPHILEYIERVQGDKTIVNVLKNEHILARFDQLKEMIAEANK